MAGSGLYPQQLEQSPIGLGLTQQHQYQQHQQHQHYQQQQHGLMRPLFVRLGHLGYPLHLLRLQYRSEGSEAQFCLILGRHARRSAMHTVQCMCAQPNRAHEYMMTNAGAPRRPCRHLAVPARAVQCMQRG